jgi:LacI family gluconate utilization system Gnt-I transcriptional repressor
MDAAQPPRNVTLDDVARLAGVSPSTVSRVLNNPEMVKAATVDAVRRAIALTGYTPNLLAGGLASKRSRMIALVVPTIANSIFSEKVQAITETLATAGYQLMLGLSGYDREQEERLVETVLGRRPDAVILTGTNHTRATRQRLLGAHIPVVETWDMSETPIDMLVGFSHEAVGAATARYVIAKGYRRPALLSASDSRAAVRASGFVAAARALGIADVPSSLVDPPAKLQLGRAGLAALLDGGAKPDVVVCSSDTLAQGALVEAQERGIAVPDDLAVIGFGDLSFAAYTLPALTTVRIDGAAIGHWAADAVLARLRNEVVEERVRNLGFEIVERVSG